MTPETIARLRALLDKATPGPWSRLEGTRVWGQVGKKYLPVVDAVLHRGTSKNAHYTAALIAESRTALPDLLDTLEAAHASGYREGLEAAAGVADEYLGLNSYCAGCIRSMATDK